MNWTDSRLNLPVCQFFNIAYDMDTPFHVLGSMQDQGSFRAPVNLAQGRDRIPAMEFEETPAARARRTPSTRRTRTSCTRPTSMEP